jgi:hypothetical protein
MRSPFLAALILACAAAPAFSQDAYAELKKKIDKENKQHKIDYAETERKRMLPAALEKLDAILKKKPGPANGDADGGAPQPFSEDEQKTVNALHKWVKTSQINSHFWITAQKARDLIAKNQALTGKAPFFLQDDKAEDYANCPGAYELDPTLGIYFQKPFFDTNNDCRREVIIHEYFHLVVGAGHYYGAKDTAEALQCPHHLAELIAQLYIGVDHAPGCERPIVADLPPPPARR